MSAVLIQSGNRKKPEIDEGAGFKENVREYLLNSTLHGLRYIGTKTISRFERTFFAMAFMLVTILASYFITNIWQKWNDSPIIIGLNPVAVEGKDIPFPALTICNMNQVRKNYAEKLPDEDKSILESVCSNKLQLNESTADQVEGTWSVIKDFLLKAAQPCNEMLHLCKFANILQNCDEIFQSVLTDDGLCCTFNAVHPKLIFKNFDQNDHFESIDYDTDETTSWTPEKGYQGNLLNIYPRQVPGPGRTMGLTLILNADVENYYCSSSSSSGFKILLHSPIELPKMANFGFSVALGFETNVVIKPAISEASDIIRSVPSEKRQCLFQIESNLSYFHTYSRKNCEMECESETVEEACGCVLYYMPKRENSKICNRKKALCYDKVLYSIAQTSDQNHSCICLPACYEVNYEREISISRLGSGSFQTSEDIFFSKDPGNVQKNIAVVHIFFQDNVFRSFTKGEFIGFTEFLSSTGGLLGLFMGFSVISLIEFIYFLSIRPYCVLKRQHKRNNSISLGIKSCEDNEIFTTHNKNMKNGNNNYNVSSWDHLRARRFWENLKIPFGFNREISNIQPYPYCN